MRVSVITTTANRPVGFALAEVFVARQTRQPEEWIVVDGGQVPVIPTRDQVYRHQPAPAGPQNFLANLRRALAAATGDVIAIVEDDDYYAPSHLESLVGRLEQSDALIAGDDDQRYYNLPHRCWRRFDNVGGCFCQTAFRADLIPMLLATIATCEQRQSYGVDTTFWRAVPRERWSIARDHLVVGMKGLPGQPGLGIGHRPDRQWTADRDGSVLRQWIGADVALYAGLSSVAA